MTIVSVPILEGVALHVIFFLSQVSYLIPRQIMVFGETVIGRLILEIKIPLGDYCRDVCFVKGKETFANEKTVIKFENVFSGSILFF